MPELLRILEKPETYYIVQLYEGDYVKVNAHSYYLSDQSTYAFFKESMEVLNKHLIKGYPPTPVFEIARKLVSSVHEEGALVTDLPQSKKPTRRKNNSPTSKVAVKKVRKQSKA